MEYWGDMRDHVKKTIDGSIGSFLERFDSLVGKMKNEMYYLKDKKDLFVKNRELRRVIAGLGNEKKECYCARGVIYRKDIHEVMHRVALINVECCNIRKDMDARHGRSGRSTA